MNSVLCNSYTEVSYILDILGEEYKNKLPKKILKLIYTNKNDDYKINLNFDITKNNINISRNALIIISILNLKYWEYDELKKDKLKNLYAKNEKIYQNKINNYKNDNWLNKNKQTIENKPVQETCLIPKKNNSLWNTIKKFIRKILNK